MCEPTTIALAVGAVSAIATGASYVAANKSADAQSKLLTQQAIQRNTEINQSAGQQLDQRAQAAREERAAARAASAESGVNLDSNSFLAQLQTSDLQQVNDNGVILKNAENQKKSTGIQYDSALAGLQKKSGLAIGVGMASSFGTAYTSMGGKTYQGRQPGTG